MQHQARGAAHGPVFPVKGVSHDRMADGVKMDADLVTSARVRRDFQKRRSREVFADAIFRHGRFAFWMDAHASGTECFERLLDFAALLQAAPNKRQVRFFDRALLELEAQVPMGIGVLGEEDQAAGAAVQAVYDKDFYP